jgi:hypothetical protein
MCRTKTSFTTLFLFALRGTFLEAGETDGKALFLEGNCNQCHSVQNHSIERTGHPMLVSVGAQTSSRDLSKERWADLSSIGNELRRAHTDPRGFDRGTDEPYKKAVKKLKSYLKGKGGSRPGEHTRHGWVRVKADESFTDRLLKKENDFYVELAGSQFVGTDEELDVLVTWIMGLRAERR